MSPPRKNPGHLPFDWALSGAYATMTMWHRLSWFGAVAMMPQSEQRQEASRMLTEKMAAAFHGGLDAGVEAMRLMAAGASGKLGPSDIVNAPAAIAQAGLQPALRLVRANSRRLNRRAAKR